MRKLKVYLDYSLRHVQMNPQEIINDTKKGAEKVPGMMEARKAMKVSFKQG